MKEYTKKKIREMLKIVEDIRKNEKTFTQDWEYENRIKNIRVELQELLSEEW